MAAASTANRRLRRAPPRRRVPGDFRVPRGGLLIMNLILDRTIEAVAPRYALRRAQARAALTLTQDYMERHAERFSTTDRRRAGARTAGCALERRQRRVDGIARVAAQSQPRPRPEQSVCGEGDRGTGRQRGRHRDRAAGEDRQQPASTRSSTRSGPTSSRPATRRSAWTSMACRLW
jgi:hypothetical protein